MVVENSSGRNRAAVRLQVGFAIHRGKVCMTCDSAERGCLDSAMELQRLTACVCQSPPVRAQRRGFAPSILKVL